MKKEKFIFISSAIFAVFNAIAQDSIRFNDSIAKKQLKEIVVSGSRSEQKINDVGRSITVITNEDIQKSGANSVAEVLTQQAGIYVVGAGQNPGMTSSVFTRGSNSNQTLFLIDGVRITDPSAINNSIDLAELALINIEKIEIVRGSHSTMYGSSAIGGIVNIITKKAYRQGLALDAGFNVGTFGRNTLALTENFSLNYAFKNGLYISGELTNTNVDGLNATVDTITSKTAYKHNYNRDGFDKLDWVTKAGFKNEKLDIYGSFKQTTQIADIDKAAYRDDDNYTLDFKRDLITYGAKYKVSDKMDVSFLGGISNMRRIAIDDSSVINSQGTFDKTYNKGLYEGKTSTNELQANYKRKGFDFVLGGGLYGEEMDVNTSYTYYNQWGTPPSYVVLKTSSDSINPTSNLSNFFIHTNIGGELFSEKLKAFNLAGGLRLNNHNAFGNYTTYEINPSVKILNGGLLYTSYSTGFNAPSLYQLYDATQYFTWDTQFSTFLTRGNKNLKPETSKTFEIGFKQTINDITFSIAYFNTEVKNSIEYVYLWNKDVAIDSLGTDWSRDDYRGDTYLNLGTMTTEGVELGMSSKVSEKFSVSANLTMLSGKLNYRPVDIDFNHTYNNHVQVYNNGAFIYDKNIETIGLTRRPSTANVSFTYSPYKSITFNANVRHVGSRGDVYYENSLGPYGALATVGVKQYTLLDLSFRANIIKLLTINFRVENVLDKKYSEINGFTTRGRGYYITMRYTL